LIWKRTRASPWPSNRQTIKAAGLGHDSLPLTTGQVNPTVER
jgi:hypothetical protein